MSKNRGMMLESIINKTIAIYAKKQKAIFHKKHVPVVLQSISKGQNNRLTIKKGFVLEKSTTDYYGIYKGAFIAFEAKSTNSCTLPLANIKAHQQNYLQLVKMHHGISFYIVFFRRYNEFFIIMPDLLATLQRRNLSIETARKKGYSIELEYPGILNFLKIIDNFV